MTIYRIACANGQTWGRFEFWSIAYLFACAWGLDAHQIEAVAEGE